MSYRREPRKLDETWILVADRANAIIYQSMWPDLNFLQELQRFHAEAGLASPEELVSDRKGRFSAYGIPSQSGDRQTSLRRKTATEFALEMIARIEQGRNTNQFGRLMIVAPAQMLGILRDTVSSPLRKTICLTLCKELVDADVREIQEQIQHAVAGKLGLELVGAHASNGKHDSRRFMNH